MKTDLFFRSFPAAANKRQQNNALVSALVLINSVHLDVLDACCHAAAVCDGVIRVKQMDHRHTHTHTHTHTRLRGLNENPLEAKEIY